MRRRPFSRISYALSAALIALASIGPAAAADAVERDVLDAFNAVVREVGDLADTEPEKAIEIYERALLDGPARGFGRLHLRIAHLHQVAGHTAEAAYHFRACLGDERVDQIDRQFICERGFEKVTAPLTIEGLPEGGVATLIEPSQFAGAYQSGARVPRGEVLLVVDAPGRRAERSTVVVDGPTLWTARVGLELPDGSLVPDGFVGEEVAPPPASGLPRWPGYAAAGLGALLVGSGVAVGVENQDTLASIRDRQRRALCGLDVCEGDLSAAQSRAQLADALWISGTALLTSGLVWWLISGDEPLIGGVP